MNAINWSDNGRAMTSSVGLVTCIVLALLSLKLYLTDDTIAAKNNSLFVLSFLTIFLPTLFVFWRFDVRRACIVGDAGTMFLGFMIATLAIIAGGKIATASIVLGIYFIDAFYVILTRIRTGKNPMKGDLSHLHHRMTEKGIDHHIQRRLVMILSFVFGCRYYLPRYMGKDCPFCHHDISRPRDRSDSSHVPTYSVSIRDYERYFLINFLSLACFIISGAFSSSIHMIASSVTCV